jgi:flagellin
VLKGEGDTLQFQVGAYGGEDNLIEFDAAATDASTENLGIGGTNVRDKQGAIENLERIDAAIGKVSAFRANFGAVQARLTSTINNLETATVNQEAARSRIEDVDVAESTAKLASAQLKNAAGTATLAQANALGNAALRLIG